MEMLSLKVKLGWFIFKKGFEGNKGRWVLGNILGPMMEIMVIFKITKAGRTGQKIE